MPKIKNNKQPNPSAENRRIFESARDHLNDASLKNTEQLDKAILSLSSAGLALSLSFSKFIQPFSNQECINLFKFSWVFFILAIISTILSFLSSNYAISKDRDYIYRYYIEENDEYGEKANIWSKATSLLNLVSGLSFIVATSLLVIYFWANT